MFGITGFTPNLFRAIWTLNTLSKNVSFQKTITIALNMHMLLL